jgi:histidine triad (HIT) family protein
MTCPICENQYKEKLLYENDKIIILQALEPASEGHLQIFTKKHYTIIEELPDDMLGYMSSAANKLSMLLFEAYKVHGTNIIIQNGLPAGQTIPHFSINIIPRRNDDNLKIDWELKQSKPEDLENVHRIISEGMNSGQEMSFVKKTQEESVVLEKQESAAPIIISDAAEESNNTAEDSRPVKKVNYFLKSLERIP